ncbi:MAG TPA: hypothetical protein VF736_19280 [Pyrinomonadaceae bacterium]|jgi:hypothetical protein
MKPPKATRPNGAGKNEAPRQKPAAPPVYRPRVAPKALQPKAATPSGPAAPPVYRPQPLPRVLQPKRAAPQPRAAQPARPAQSPPAPPPVYRPQPQPAVLQRKPALPAVAPAPSRAATPTAPQAPPPRRCAPPAPPVVQRLAAPAAPRPAAPGRPSVVQRALDETVTSGRTPRKVKPNRQYDADFYNDEEMVVETGEQVLDSGAIDNFEQDDDYQQEDDQPQPGDFDLPGQKEPWPFGRPGWKAGTYAQLFATQFTVAKGLTCGVCGKAIALTVASVAGKERWVSKSGKVHETKPPIDHDNPDWIVRLGNLKQRLRTSQVPLSNKDIRQLVVNEYHKPTLRLTHMVCNSAKPKAHM